MSPDSPKGLAIVRQQLAELEVLAQHTLQDLNTVAGTERVGKWKARTATLIASAISPQEGQQFATVHPGPSFTNDMVEEFTDLIECYRTALASLAKKLEQALPNKS